MRYERIRQAMTPERCKYVAPDGRSLACAREVGHEGPHGHPYVFERFTWMVCCRCGLSDDCIVKPSECDLRVLRDSLWDRGLAPTHDKAARVCLEAGVPVENHATHPSWWSSGSSVPWIPKWAWLVIGAWDHESLGEAVSRVLARLANDPLAVAMFEAHPDSISAMLQEEATR
jgi:hypothetical protein